MPGMVADMDLTEALAVIVAMDDDPAFPVFASEAERALLYSEAVRVVEEHAAKAIRRNLGSSNVEQFARKAI